MFRNWLVPFIAVATSLVIKAGSVNYNFEDNIPPGVLVENAPALLVDSALKIVTEVYGFLIVMDK